MESDLPLWPPDLRSVTLPPWCCVELKYLDADDFGHWSHTDFDASPRSRRKRREWQVFHALAEGGEPPPGILPVEAPDDRYVIDYVRSTWLPPKGGELTELSERPARLLLHDGDPSRAGATMRERLIESPGLVLPVTVI